MDIKIFSLAAAMLTTFSVLAYDTQPRLIDHGAYTTPEMEIQLTDLLSRQNTFKKRIGESTDGTEEPSVIDVAVFMHSSWIDTLKEPVSKDANGKFYENGTQFALARIKAQFDYFNETLAMQKINARLQPAYFTTVSLAPVVKNASGDHEDFSVIVNCMQAEEGTSLFESIKPFCESENLLPLRQKLHDKIDIVYFIRSRIPADTFLGKGAPTIGANVNDTYLSTMKAAVAEGASEDFKQDIRFGYLNADVFSHEMGHVFGARHHIYAQEPATEEDNRAYACGNRLDNIPKVAGDLSTMRKTIMWSTTGQHHRFFSDSEIVVDGDPCGVIGIANNVTTVRQFAPRVSQNNNMPAQSSEISFVEPTSTVRRELEKAALLLRRTGDLSKPAYLSVAAKDDTAWENLDFTFGLQELTFTAGESEKTIEITLLPRARGHANTKFNIVILAAIGASYAPTGAEVTILSDKAIQHGQLSFTNSQTEVIEGATADLTIHRTNGVDGDISFSVTPVNGTAIKGTDYNAEVLVKTLKDNESSLIISIPTIKRMGKQGARALTLNISEVSGGATVGTLSQATISINDAAEHGTLGFASANINVDETGSANLMINRTNGTDGEVTVRVQTMNGTAISGTDFNALNQVVSIPAGQSSASVVVNIVNRSGNQNSRYFDVQLSEPTGGASLSSSVTSRVTISDVATATDGSDSSGGSVGIYALIGLLILGTRRHQSVKK